MKITVNYGDSLLNTLIRILSLMVRIARLVVPGLPHHFTQRGNGRAQVFFEVHDIRED